MISSVGFLLALSTAFLPAEGKKGDAVKLTAAEKAIFEKLNEERQKAKLPLLKLHPLLQKAAKQHTENMARQDKLSHDLDDKGVGQRVTETGYEYRIVGENLAKAEAEGDSDPPAPSAAEIHKMWMESKGHRANILNEKYEEVGISIARSKKGTYYYTQVFGAARK